MSGSRKSREASLAVLRPSTVIAETAAYIFRTSAHCVTGDPDIDLSDAQFLDLMHHAEDLLVFIGVLPEDWVSVVQPRRHK